jgi:hypothetical protein
VPKFLKLPGANWDLPIPFDPIPFQSEDVWSAGQAIFSFSTPLRSIIIKRFVTA